MHRSPQAGPRQMADVTMTVEQVHSMDFNELCEILDSKDVDYTFLENIEDVRDLVIQSVTDRNSSDVTCHSQEQASSDVIGRMLERDAEMRKVISDIYTSILDMLKMKNFEENLGSEMTKEYNGYLETVRVHKKQLKRKHCAIVVAGETGAGKSSLLNLIMGEHVLPRQVISSTSTICQIFNSEEKRAVVIDKNGEEIHLHDVTEETLSDFVSVNRSEQNTKRYKRVDIYWPLPMLKEYATIVAMPEVGESEEMTNILMDYLSEAVAFIYVINTTNAGGVQDDRLVKLFTKQHEFESKGRLLQFDPECAIFVCNKWDQIPHEEEVQVWDHIVKRLQAYWPTRKDVNITNQMFKLSVAEDLRRSKAGLGYTEKFRSLMSGIDRLVSASLERRVKRHVEWQETFLDRLLVKVVAKINASKKNQGDKMAMKTEMEKRLRTLENETEDVKIKMEEIAEEECQRIAEELTNHLHNDETKQRMFQWHADELPDGHDLDIIQYQAKQLIGDKISNEIVTWCQDNHIEDTSTRLFDLFIEECKLIKRNYREIDQTIQGIADGNVPQGAENSSDFESSNFTSIFPLKKRIALVAFAPLWLPLVIGASILALPVALGILVKDTLVDKKKINHFRQDKMVHMLKLAELEMTNYSTDLVFNGLRQTYMRDFMASLEQVCENIIPKQIKADQELIGNILKEDRDSQTLKQEYTPIERKCKEIIGNLLYAKLAHLSDQPCIKREIRQLGRGSYSTVILCDVQIGNREVECAVKKMTSPLRHELYLQLMEAANMRTFQHPNIVRCYGISVDKVANQREHLDILMEPCDCSLEDIILCDRHPMEMCHCSQQRRQTCHVFPEKDRNQQGYVEAWGFFMQMLEGIVNGLVYLHEKGFVHRDLKLSNILVKDNTAKIADFGMSKSENLLQRTITGTPVFMAPEVLEGRMYSRSTNIFSLAIVMWEMWYGRRVFSEILSFAVLTSCPSIKEHVLGGARPKFSERTPPPEEIRTLMENCWTEVADDRPTARQLITRLRDIAVALS
uniref:Uncharacterized protein LOC111110781 n=1 Tax=Crassostrea virginica TaxID=6565 RepID=A0A8B8BJS9_CRAVI|nr:uncharacterized protein LOC111110781 [Crassostrea virginica]